MPDKFSNKDIKIQVGEPIVNYLQQNPSELLKIDAVRRAYGFERYKILKNHLRAVESNSNEHLTDNAISHNMGALDHFNMEARPGRLLHPLLSVDRVYFNRHNLKLLVIGPRTEMELFQYAAYGFQLENITALDLFSYSPLVEIGDMHAMPFANDSFDIVISGWVLPYSVDVATAVREMLRVCKDGGLIALGVGTETILRFDRNDHSRDVVVTKSAQLEALMEGYIARRILNHDADPVYGPSPDRDAAAVMSIVEIDKSGSGGSRS